MLLHETPLFSHFTINRSTLLRSKPAKIKQLFTNPTSKHYFVWKGKLLFDCNNETPILTSLNYYHRSISFCKKEYNYEPIFLGIDKNIPLFLHDISDWNDKKENNTKKFSFDDPTRNYHPQFPKNWFFCETRNILNLLSFKDAEICAIAKGIFEWHQTNKFCTNCGYETETKMQGWERHCPVCAFKHFPRTDPVVIMLIINKGKTLLGRSPNWPSGLYSCLAGFMEPGESIEAAVRRETYEEAGVTLNKVEYVTSQPWPFPASLMIGCTAEAKSQILNIDEKELEDAIWVTRTELDYVINNQNPSWSPARVGSIARFLIDSWRHKIL